MKRVVYLGGKELGTVCLKHLLDVREDLGVEVVAVSSGRKNLFDGSDSINALAEQNGIPIIHELSELDRFEDIDIIMSITYSKILKQRHIDRAKQIAINLHMAPLPEFRGCNQFSFAILEERKEFGTTIHRLEAGIDSGDILFEKRFPIPENCFVKGLYDITFEHSVDMFKKNLPDIIDGKYEAKPQESMVSERGTAYHFRKEIDEVKAIDPSWDSEQQKRHFRATWFPPFPAPYLKQDGTRVDLDMDWYNSLA